MRRASPYWWAPLLALSTSACSGPQRLEQGIDGVAIGRSSPSAMAMEARVEGVRSGPIRVAAAPANEVAADQGDVALHTDLIRTMIAQGQFYAAVAHIEAQQAQGGTSAELRWLEADARRRLGQYPQATTLLRSLLRGPYAAQAEHGLGLIATAQQRPQDAILAFENAVRRAPTQADYRNDLGYAHLQTGRFDEALMHLATASELAPADARIRSNLVLLLLTTGDETRARAVADTSGIDGPTYTRLQLQAQALRLRASGQAAASPPRRFQP